jgi:hypothetical protein
LITGQRRARPLRAGSIVEQCGGWFTLRSRKGEGTTAELWLPLAPSNAPKTEISGDHSPNIIPNFPLVILTVDDDELVLTNNEHRPRFDHVSPA